MSATGAHAGLLSVWNDIGAEHDAQFNAWYNGEHLGERLALPGFLGGARYRGLASPLSYAALYDTRSVADLRSPQYQACLANPSPGTRAIMPQFRNMVRAISEVVLDTGKPGGAVPRLAILELPASDGVVSEALRAQVLALGACAGIARVRLAVPTPLETDNPEAEFRAVPDRTPPPFVLIEGGDDATLHAAALALGVATEFGVRLYAPIRAGGRDTLAGAA